ncbi:MAG: hypothetical protein AMJ84_04875 [Acidithiobacillales bacterium SM23_46]|nr:MAG: hypothetical protein AMJ84_04875 [Acidithiobacillales bacterium SM23_46]
MAAGLDPWVSFVGVLPSESLHILGSPEIDLDKVPSGYQTCQAYSLEYLLQKRRLIGSRCMEQGLTPQDVVTIDRQLPFNRRSFQGIRPLGNRSKVREKDIGDNDLTFIFGAEAIEGGIPRWRARDILEYVLANSHLGDVEGIEPLFVLGGPDDPDDPNPEVDVLAMLEGIYPVIDQGHRTALEIISEIVTRRRGLSAYVKWTPIAAPGMEQGLPEAGSDVELYVCSMTDIVGEVAGKTMPKNAEVYDCNLEEGIDIGEAILEEDGINRQDRIVVYGRPVLTCFSAACFDLSETLQIALIERGWPAADETTYKTVDDTARRRPRYSDVYRRFDLAAGLSGPVFDWLPNMATPDCTYNPEIQSNGAILPNTPGRHFSAFNGLSRLLPITCEADIAGEADDERQEGPIAFVEVLVDGAGTGVYVPVVSPPEDSPAGFVQPNPDHLSIEIRYSPNHLLAANHFDPSESGTEASETTPIFDYEKMIVTIAARADTRPRVEWVDTSGTQAFYDHALVIEVPEAEVWLVAPRTVRGLSATGALEYYTGPYLDPAAHTVRDDTDLLRQVAALAAAWYGRERKKIVVERVGLIADNPVGTIMRNVLTNYYRDDVYTPVTQIAYDYVDFRTTWQTGHIELDVMGAVTERL